jgi:GGDEF domain-containing protein
MQFRKIAFSTAFVRHENSGMMGIVCAFQAIADDHGKHGTGDEVVKEVVEEWAERLHIALQVKDVKENNQEMREVR